MERDPLDARELLIAEALLAGRKFSEIETEHGIPHSTAHRISHLPHVAAFMREIQDAAEQVVRRRLLRVAPDAVDALGRIMDDEAAPAPARVAAASKILDAVLPKRSEVSGPRGDAIQIDVSTARAAVAAVLAGTSDAELGIPDFGDGVA